MADFEDFEKVIRKWPILKIFDFFIDLKSCILTKLDFLIDLRVVRKSLLSGVYLKKDQTSKVNVEN